MLTILLVLLGRVADKYGSRGFATLGLALFGLGRSLFSSPNSSSIMGSVPAQRRGVANGVRTTLTQTRACTHDLHNAI